VQSLVRPQNRARQLALRSLVPRSLANAGAVCRTFYSGRSGLSNEGPPIAAGAWTKGVGTPVVQQAPLAVVRDGRSRRGVPPSGGRYGPYAQYQPRPASGFRKLHGDLYPEILCRTPIDPKSRRLPARRSRGSLTRGWAGIKILQGCRRVAFPTCDRIRLQRSPSQ
jgi:hypothetical protein